MKAAATRDEVTMETSDVDGNDGESDRGSDCDGDSEWESLLWE